MAVEDAGSKTVRLDRLIIDLQQELNKVIALIVNPPKDGRISSGKRPSAVKPPGAPAASGWSITPFGEQCLAYLDDVDFEPSPTEVDVAAGEDQDQS